MNLIDLNFDRIYLLNLRRRADRLAHAERELEKLGLKEHFTVFEGWDAQAIGLSHSEKGYTPGMVGCFMSHAGAMKDAWRNGFERILILEDDFIVVSGGYSLLEDSLPLLPKDWEFANFGYRFSGRIGRVKSVTVNDRWIIPGKTYGGDAYAINGRKALRRILDGLEEMRNQIDLQLSWEVLPESGLKYYAMNPPAIQQESVLTDVQTHRAPKWMAFSR